MARFEDQPIPSEIETLSSLPTHKFISHIIHSIAEGVQNTAQLDRPLTNTEYYRWQLQAHLNIERRMALVEAFCARHPSVSPPTVHRAAYRRYQRLTDSPYKVRL